MTPEITIAQALRDHRESEGMTKAAMAEWLGISREHYHKLESGAANNPRLRTIWAFFQERVGIEVIADCSGNDDHFHLVAGPDRPTKSTTDVG